MWTYDTYVRIHPYQSYFRAILWIRSTPTALRPMSCQRLSGFERALHPQLNAIACSVGIGLGFVLGWDRPREMKGGNHMKKEETIWKNIWGSIKVDFSVEQNRYLILSVADDISEQIGKGKASKFSPNDAEWPRYHPTEDITGRNNFVLSSDLLILSLGI